MKKIVILCFLLLALPLQAFAAEIPTDITIQNLNGSQQYIKTYIVPPGTDPETLKEEPFAYEDFTYTFAAIIKQENHCDRQRTQRETVTVHTEKKDLPAILTALAPTLDYDCGGYQGTLPLDHTTLSTQAAGYVTKRYTATATKELGGLPGNDMSYVPDTTVKDGSTLSLSGVDWQVEATALVDGALIPAQYRAVATYSAPVSYRAATGYITTADYVGEVTYGALESITYTLTYLGKAEKGRSFSLPTAITEHPILLLGGILVVAGLTILAILLILSRREIGRLREEQDSCVPSESDDNFKEEDAI